MSNLFDGLVHLLPALVLASAALLALPAARAADTAATPAPPPSATAATYRALAEETETNLQKQVLAQWFPRSVNPAGGFYQNYTEDWTRGSGNSKAIVYQARLTWLAAQEAQRSPAHKAAYNTYAKHGLDFLAAKMWDAKNGGFYWELGEDGTPTRGGEKHLYGNSFAIYALAGVYEATKDPRALDLAKQAYAWLNAHAYDKAHGGYYEALTQEGTPILAPTADGGATDEIGTRYGCKTMNSHIHLLEALSALYAVWPDTGLHARLEEMFVLVRDKVAVEQVGCLNYLFLPDWTPLPNYDSYGHDIETAYLMVEAATALGRPDDTRTWALARRLVDHTLDFGEDKVNGGIYDGGPVYSNSPSAPDKVWWVQAEALNALLLMHRHFGAEDPRYWAAFHRQWRFIQTRQIDYRVGGWYPAVQENGATLPGRAKSDGWTEGYHQGRALINVTAALRALAAQAAPR